MAVFVFLETRTLKCMSPSFLHLEGCTDYADAATDGLGCLLSDAGSILIFGYLMIMISETGECCVVCGTRD